METTEIPGDIGGLLERTFDTVAKGYSYREKIGERVEKYLAGEKKKYPDWQMKFYGYPSILFHGTELEGR